MASVFQLPTLFVLVLVVYFANVTGQADELKRYSYEDDSTENDSKDPDWIYTQPTTATSSSKKPSKLPAIIATTPSPLKPSKPSSTGGQKPSKDPVTSGKPSVPAVECPNKPLPSPSGPIDPVPSICGRKSYCYQWFDDELDLSVEEYELCDIKDEFRARRYCCIR